VIIRNAKLLNCWKHRIAVITQMITQVWSNIYQRLTHQTCNVLSIDSLPLKKFLLRYTASNIFSILALYRVFRRGHITLYLATWWDRRKSDQVYSMREVQLTIKHILVECRRTEAARTKYTIPAEFLSTIPPRSERNNTIKQARKIKNLNLL